jgi:hypothetical protein
VSDGEMLVMFVTADGEDNTRKIFRRAQSGIKCEGRKRKQTTIQKFRKIKYLSLYLTGKYKLGFLIFQIIFF